MPGASWSDEIDEVIGGDLTAALAYATPAGGAVVTPVAPIGLRDREAGTVTFTTSLGLGKKLERIRREPRVALAYHAREHGFSRSSLYVLVQGWAKITEHPDREYLEDVIGPAAARFLGAPRSGVFWDRWLREYYADRVPVEVTVERIVTWRELDCSGPPAVTGVSLPGQRPPTQEPPAKGTLPRVDSPRVAKRLRRLRHVLVGFPQLDGFPVVLPCQVGADNAHGIAIDAPAGLPDGGRRAGLLGHDYGPQLTGLRVRQHTGWLDVDEEPVYSAHTEQGFRAPGNKTIVLLVNGLVAKRGLSKARKSGAAAAQ